MSNQEGFLPQLKRHEGLELKMYQCSQGYNTIGYGFNLDEHPIPQEIAEALLDHMVMRMMDEIEASPEMKIISGLSKPRQGVILNMWYNLGKTRIKGFKKMWAALAAGDYEKAAAEMLDSKWAVQVGNRSRELARQMRVGEWQTKAPSMNDIMEG